MKKRCVCILIATFLFALFACLHISAADYVRGDVHNSGIVDSKDAIYLLRHVLDGDKYTLTQNGDMNRDGAVNTNDAIYLLRYTISPDIYQIDCDSLGHEYVGSKCKYCGEIINDVINISKFSSDVNYKYLGTLSNGADMQAFYNALDNSMTEFHLDTTLDAQILMQENNTWYTVANTNFSNFGLTKEQAFQVWRGYRDDHPLYYWLLDFIYSSDEIITITYSDYVDGDDRADYNEQIYKAIDEYISEASEETSLYAKSSVYFDDIIRACKYKTFEGTKPFTKLYRECTIIGPLLDKSAFNSGFAKLYQLLLNYEGIENWFAWNETPEFIAWNLVKLDDENWYWYDLAKADNNAADEWDTYSYFCQTASTLPADRTAFVADYSPVAPTLSNNAFSVEGIVEIHSNFNVDSVKYKLLNSDREVIVVSHNYDTVDSITPTITYRDVEYKVMDVVSNGSEYINMSAYESMACYNYLGTLSNGRKLQQMYEEFDAKLTLFHIGEVDNAYSSKTSDGKLYKTACKVNYGKYGVTRNQAMMVNRFYRMDHPLYYWIDTVWLSSPLDSNGNGYVRPCTPDEYDTYSEREAQASKVYEGIKHYTSCSIGETNAYSLALSAYDSLITSCEYAHNSSGEPEGALWAHSILGAFTKNSFVCEGYAKLFQLLMTYYKVDNMYVTGDARGGHAWNLVKLDDGKWYWCDATWGDGTDFFKYFCTTDSILFQTHTPDSTVNSSTPWDIIPALPSRATSSYSDSSILRLMDTFTANGRTYRLVGFNKVECISTLTPGEALPKTVSYNGKIYNVVVHLIHSKYWDYSNNTYCADCTACNASVNMYEVENEILELTFEDSIENEISKYDGFTVVSPNKFTRTAEANGNHMLTSSLPLHIDVDRQMLADLKTFAITFDLKINNKGNAGLEISVLSLLSNYRNGAQIPGTSVNRGWFLKYNVDEKKFETLKVSGVTSKLNDRNSMDISFNTTYNVSIIVDTVTRKSYVVVDGKTLGVAERSPWCLPDLSLEKYDDALSIRFNDGGNCSMSYDNLRIVAIN